MTSPHAIALSHYAPFGPKTCVALFARFSDYESIWNASFDDLRACGLTENAVTKFFAYRERTNPQKLVDQVASLGIDTVDRNDPRFPEALKTIYDPPIILYVRGQLPTTSECIGIVGARDATAYGLSVARKFANELSRANMVVVSGLARGIDLAAHTGAMDAGGKTVAVLAHGLEELKGSKRDFAKRIVDQGGAVISEQPPFMAAEKFHFPIRNRIIAGISRGVLVVEAKLPSGSLTTAQSALKEHREVFAIPGQIDSPVSVGTNTLLQDGAHVTMSPNDILSVLGLPTAKPRPEPLLVHEPPSPDRGRLGGANLSPEQTSILSLLTNNPLHVDELARLAKLPVPTILSTLTMLEIHGKVRHLGNMHYSL